MVPVDEPTDQEADGSEGQEPAGKDQEEVLEHVDLILGFEMLEAIKIERRWVGERLDLLRA
jgi:hypothetical protein